LDKTPQAVLEATDVQLQELGIPLLPALGSGAQETGSGTQETGSGSGVAASGSSGDCIEPTLAALAVQDSTAGPQRQQDSGTASGNAACGGGGDVGSAPDACDGAAIPEVAAPDAATLDHAVLVCLGS
jgi:hypothetical protein